MATIDSENFACAHEQIVVNRIILDVGFQKRCERKEDREGAMRTISHFS